MKIAPLQDILSRIPFQSVLQNIVDIPTKNAVFDALSDEDKRKEIAYDGLILIAREVVFGESDGYWGDKLFVKSRTIEDSKALCQFLNELPDEYKCHVCARGLTMLSQIRLGNKLAFIDEFSSEAAKHNDILTKGDDDVLNGFSLESMEYMEKEYEFTEYGHPYYTNTTPKLANIACNVLQNGDFNREDKTNYLMLWDLKIS